ncbi:MAG: hypothetical protein ABIB79_01930 [archaeon]
MNSTIKSKIEIIAIFGIIYLLLLSPLAFAADSYSMSTPQFSQPRSSATYLERQGVSLTPQWDESKCEAGQDFVLQIDPTGCEPSVIPSSLLEDQNTPVLCPIMATKINPLIDVNAIKDLRFTFEGKKPEEVSGVAYHPARAALRTGDTLLNSPILENVGYAVIVLKQQKNESAMPEWVEGNLSVEIRYDIKNAFGIGDGTLYVPELNENDWDSKYLNYGFWKNKFFLRAEDIETNGATIAIYSSKDIRHSSVSLGVGKTSDTLYLPGQYCQAGVQLTLESLDNPGTRARFYVDDEVIEVVKGQRFLDNKCWVSKFTDNEVWVNCKEDDKQRTYKFSRIDKEETLSSEIKSDYNAAIANYEKVINDYPEEKVLDDLKKGANIYYGEQALEEAIGLAKDFDQEDDVIRLEAKMRDVYDNGYIGIDIKDSKNVRVNGATVKISFMEVENSEFKDHGVDLEIDGEETLKLEKDLPKTDISFGNDQVTVELTKLTEDYASIKVKVEDKSTTLTIKEGETGEYRGHKFRLKQIYLTQIAKVKVTPKINNAKTDSNLHFKIGIEKRDIKLSPDKIRDKIAEMNETIEKWQDRSDKLGQVVKGMKGACLATGAVLTLKNLFNGVTSGSANSRNLAMRGSDGKGGVVNWCRDKYKERGDKTVEQCISNNPDLINEMQEINEGIIEKQSVYLEQFRKDCPLEGASSVPGESVVDDTNCYKPEYADYIKQKWKVKIDPSLTSINELRNIDYSYLAEEAAKGDYSEGAKEILNLEASKRDSILDKIAEAGVEANTKDNDPLLGNFNKADDLKVKYFDRAPNKNVPAIVPLINSCEPKLGDKSGGWYVGTQYELDGTVHESWATKEIFICNVGDNGKINFDPETGATGGDECTLVDSNFGVPKDAELPGITKDQTPDLYRRAKQAYSEAAANYREGITQIKYCGKTIGIDKIANLPGTQCEEFMDPEDCKILFNVCDPVVCPSSRCNFGGKYVLTDVIQSGIIGSTFACLQNFVGFGGDVIIPVCLSGIHAGLEGLLSVFKAYRDCLQYNLDTGETVGICDEIYSIHLCDFFWKQVAPVADIIIPKLLEFATGQFVRGGGEYRGVQAAWDNAGKSMEYFTQYYAVNAFKMFKAKSITEVGSEVCQNSLSASYPDGKSFLDALTEPVSPPQFHGWLDYSLYSGATVPPTYKYSVFYHIYAGTEEAEEIRYLVYLRAPAELGGRTAEIDSGKIKRGGYKTEKKDLTGAVGFNELCIVVGTQEKCGFKKVTSSFALNYASDEYVKQQAGTVDVKSKEECTSGSSSAYSFINPNAQAGAENFVNPDLRGMGIVRICSTLNPGAGTDPGRWQDVGYCTDEKMRCWLDTKSVNKAASLDRIDEDGLLGEIDTLNKGGADSKLFYTDDAATRLADLRDKILNGWNTGNKILLEEVIRDIEHIETGDTEKKLFYPKHLAGLQLLKGRAYNYLARLGKYDVDVKEAVVGLESDEQSTTESSGDIDSENGVGRGGGEQPESCQVQIGKKIIDIAKDFNKNYDVSVKEDTGAKSFECLVLQVAMQESGLKHCKTLNSENNCFGCAEVLTGDDESSYGVMQLNEDYFTVQDMTIFENNIEEGIKHLINNYDPEKTKQYSCLNDNQPVNYRGWERALRFYNGWNTDCSKGNNYYVIDVEDKRFEIVRLFPDICREEVTEECDPPCDGLTRDTVQT